MSTGKTYSTITKALDIIGIKYRDYKEAQELFQNELGKAYPEGVTEEKNQGKRKDITKRVVVKEGVGSEFFKIHHDWGGIYYFLDGESIDPYKWQYGTRSPDQINNP